MLDLVERETLHGIYARGHDAYSLPNACYGLGTRPESEDACHHGRGEETLVVHGGLTITSKTSSLKIKNLVVSKKLTDIGLWSHAECTD